VARHRDRGNVVAFPLMYRTTLGAFDQVNPLTSKRRGHWALGVAVFRKVCCRWLRRAS